MRRYIMLCKIIYLGQWLEVMSPKNAKK